MGQNICYLFRRVASSLCSDSSTMSFSINPYETELGRRELVKCDRFRTLWVVAHRFAWHDSRPGECESPQRSDGTFRACLASRRAHSMSRISPWTFVRNITVPGVLAVGKHLRYTRPRNSTWQIHQNHCREFANHSFDSEFNLNI